MLPHQPFEFRDDVRMTPQRQVGVDASFECLQPQILQACHVRPCEQFVPELGERLTPEEPQRLAEQRLPLIRGTPLRFGEKPLEAIEIELAVLDVDPVAVATRDPIGTEDLAQAADVTLEGVACRGRRGRASASRAWSTVTRSPACNRSSASSARCFHRDGVTSRPSSSTSSGPRMRNSTSHSHTGSGASTRVSETSARSCTLATHRKEMACPHAS